MMSGRVARVQLDPSPEFRVGGFQIPVEAIQAESKGRMGLAERAIELQRLDRRGLRLRKGFLGSKHSIFPVAQQGIRVGQTTVRLRVVWIALNRLFEIVDRLFEVVAGSLVPEVSPLEVRLVRLGIDEFVVLQRGLFLRVEVDSNLLRDRSRDPVLQCQHVAQIAVVRLGPQVPVIACLNQLRRNPNLIAGAEDSAFYHSVHVQLAGDLGQRLARTFVRHHRGPRDHT